jgi:hypothetical protein
MEVRTLDGVEIAQKYGLLLGAEHDALVAEADFHLSCGRAEDAAPIVARLAAEFPTSGQLARVQERLRIVAESNAYWRRNGGTDFLSLFWQASGGAFSVGAGMVCLGLGLLCFCVALSRLFGGEVGTGVLALLGAVALLFFGTGIFRRGRSA